MSEVPDNLAKQAAWDAAASGWLSWWTLFERGAGHVSDRMVELAQLEPHARVLCLATGIGEPALTVARQLGEGAEILAIDLSRKMLDIARERATGAGVTNVTFALMDAQALDLPEAHFDAVMCRWSMFLFTDLPRVLTRVHDVLKPGGRFVATVFGAPATAPALSLPLRVITKLMGKPLPAGNPGPFALSDLDDLGRQYKWAGFPDIATEPIANTVTFDSAAQYTSFIRDISGVLRAFIASETPERQAELWRAVEDEVRPFADDDGVIHMPMSSIAVVARRPQ